MGLAAGASSLVGSAFLGSVFLTSTFLRAMVLNVGGVQGERECEGREEAIPKHKWSKALLKLLYVLRPGGEMGPINKVLWHTIKGRILK